MTIRIAVVDCGSGNLRSVTKALEHCLPELGGEVFITTTPDDLKAASHIVLPGVGAFGDCMRGLTALPGMVEALENEVRGNKKPFFGICVGMQMLFEEGHEFGVHKGLGWLRGKVKAIDVDASYKIPHMGWNTLDVAAPQHAYFQGIEPNSDAYFVHSFHAVETTPEDVVAYTEYGTKIVAAVAQGNIFATQFHPEKSQGVGLCLLRNFIASKTATSA